METLTFHPQQTAASPVSKKFPFEIRVLARDAGRADVFALRYRAYREAWCIPFDAREQYSDHFDDLASTIIFGAYDAGVCVGTLRVNFSHAWQGCETLPCAERYPDVAGEKAKTDGTVMEVSRLSIDPAITNTSYRTTLYASLLRAGFMAAQAGNVAKILLVTKPDWIRFYQYMLGFKTIGEPQIYPPSKEPVALLGGSFGDAQKHQRAQNAFFKITTEEIASMKSAIFSALVMPAPLEATAKGRF